jgi:hypothetical protein
MMVQLKHHKLTHDHFCAHPVWEWVDSVEDETLVTPVVVPTKELPHDRGPLFVKAIFRTLNDQNLNGHIILNETVEVIGIWDEDKFSTFNRNEQGFPIMMKWQEDLKRKLGCPLFPIQYRTDYTWYGAPLEGEFELL